jgi:phosphoglycolate phosphatase
MNLIIFDCDGTIVDSQNAIVLAMNHAFSSLGLTAPTRAETLSIVGLSLPEVFDTLAPSQTAATRAKLIDLYKSDFPLARAKVAAEDPLFPGAAEAIATLAARADVCLGIATGKSIRGVDRLLDHYDWRGHFVTLQTADTNPSKPHPGMITAAMAEAGVDDRRRVIMIGDTTYDIEMARRAGVGALGVAWGYHPVGDLERVGAHAIAETYGQVPSLVDHLLLQHQTTVPESTAR